MFGHKPERRVRRQALEVWGGGCPWEDYEAVFCGRERPEMEKEGGESAERGGKRGIGQEANKTCERKSGVLNIPPDKDAECEVAAHHSKSKRAAGVKMRTLACWRASRADPNSKSDAGDQPTSKLPRKGKKGKGRLEQKKPNKKDS